MTEAAESLIAQINSHSKLTTPKRENQKFNTKTKFLKTKEQAP
jgi:hypothetical protein